MASRGMKYIPEPCYGGICRHNTDNATMKKSEIYVEIWHQTL